MPALTTPGLYYQKVDFGAARIPRVRIDAAGFLGIASRGPLHVPVPVRSWAQFQARFGAFIETGFLAYAIKAFFENGGEECHIVRIAAAVGATATDPIAVQPADKSFSIVLSVAGFVPGAVVTVKQAPDRVVNALLTVVDTITRKITWSKPLPAEFQAAVPMEFAVGASPAQNTFLDGTGQPVLRVTAESPGVWGNRFRVRVARNVRAATRTRVAVQPVTGDSSLVQTLAGFAPRALVKAFQDQLPLPLEKWHFVESVDPANNRIVWSTALDPAFDLTKPITFEVLDFSLSVFEQGTLREVFEGLSLVVGHSRYVETATSVSRFIRVEDLLSITAFPAKLPDPSAPNLKFGLLQLRGGRDGTAGLTIKDFTGELGAQEKWGIRVFEENRDVGAIAAPDLLMPPTPAIEFAPLPPSATNPCLPPCEPVPPEEPPLLPEIQEAAPGFSLQEIELAQQALIEHCANHRYRVALLDAPRFSTAKASVDLAEIPAWRNRFDSKYGGLYFPWLLVNEPTPVRGRMIRAVPPSGHVAGIIARTDIERGVHHAPANQSVVWAADVTVRVDAGQQGFLNPLGINCIRAFPGAGLLLYGARTISSDPLWTYLNVRRLMIVIAKSAEQALQWSVFEPNDDALRQTIRLALSSLLEELWVQGALRGTVPEEAFFVVCDDSNNPPDLVENGQLLVHVGVAPSIPAEFVVFRIGRVNDALTVTEV